MNLERIKEGKIYKNYKQMCTLLHEEEKGGHQKELQINNWKRFFDFEKNGHQFKIIKIYDNPLPVEDKRQRGNNAKYIGHIEKIIIGYLSSQNNMYTATFADWYNILGLVNDFYKDIRKEKTKEASWTTKYFIQMCNQRLRQILISSLKSLKKRNIIDYESTYIILPKIDITLKNQNYEFITVTEYEKTIIHEVENNMLKKLGYTKISDIFLHNKHDKFYSLVNEKLSHFIKDFYGYYSVLTINLLDNTNLTDNDINILDEKLKLNDKVVSALQSELTKRNEKMIHDYNTKEPAYIGVKPKSRFMYYGDLIAEQKIYIDKYIKLDKEHSR